MAGAVVRISYFGESASTPAGTSGETTGMCFNRNDTRSSGSAPVAIPTGVSGTNYSYPKYLALEVTTTGTTSISNRQVAMSSQPPAGLKLYWGTSSAYVQPAANIAADTTGDDIDPDGATTDWTLLTTSYVAYSTYSSDTAAGKNGNYVKLGLGVSSTATYLGGPGSAIALPNVTLQYDEA